MSDKSLYERLGGHDAIAAVTDALMVRIKDDDKLRRFYDHRGADGVARATIIGRFSVRVVGRTDGLHGP